MSLFVNPEAMPGPILSLSLTIKYFLPSFSSFQEGLCQLQERVCARSTG